MNAMRTQRLVSANGNTANEVVRGWRRYAFAAASAATLAACLHADEPGVRESNGHGGHVVGTSTSGDTKPAEPVLPFTQSDPTLYVVGYAHLDTQWRWTYVDTIREYIPATLIDNFKLFEKHPNYVFNFSGSRRYRMMEEYYPAEFERMKEYVRSGKWFPCGSSVDENDANVPSAESLIRQVLYGNKYFRQKFGIASEEFMLPDCFGFPAALPSVLAHCGITGFSTQKLTWGGVVPIPFKVGVWEGPDGRGVIAALDPGEYVGQVKENLSKSNAWKQRIDANGRKSGLYVDYHYYGTGDTGGAPAAASVAMVEESIKSGQSGEGAIKIISAPADAMFKAITPEQRGKLPRYKGELMLTEHSAGSISSQAYMKRWNRKNERLADAAEKAAVMANWLGGREYPAARIEDAWYLVLGSQMHDILPGTSVPLAYDFSWNDECIAANQFAAVLTDSVDAIVGAMDTSGPGTPVVVYNPLSFDRYDVVEAEIPISAALGQEIVAARATGSYGRSALAQILDRNDKSVRVAFVAKAPSVGFSVYTIELLSMRQVGDATLLKVSERQLENARYLVKLDARGDVSSIFDKTLKKELLAAPIRLGLYHENPRNWPAWNQDWADRQMPAKAFAGAEGLVSFQVVEKGPVRVAVEVTREAEGSRFVQRISLAAGSAGDRVEFDTRIDWRTRERSLRAVFPLTASNPMATYDMQTGAIERGNGHAKQYEYPFHEWFDLTDAKGEYGVTVMCDSKYAADKPSDNTVRLTLLHTPGTRGGYPDQGTQDLGRHRVLFAVAGHAGDWVTSRSFVEAACLNQPLHAFRATVHQGPLGRIYSFARTSNEMVTISAIKRSESGDEVIVRLREQGGKPIQGVNVIFARPVVSAREVDGQEREIGPARIVNDTLVTDIGGFELRAFAVKLAAPQTALNKVASIPVELPFDTDVFSTNANRTDGSMDSRGRAIPAEDFPGSLSMDGVNFRLGSTADGAKNAVSCRGQEIMLPDSSAGERPFNKLCVLAAADGDIHSSLAINGKSVPWHVQDWTGYIGLWDTREWPGDVFDPRYSWNREPIGLRPGFVKQDSLAWYCSHHHTAAGDAFYRFSYIFRYVFELPDGTNSIKLPDDPNIKVFAMSVVSAGAAHAVSASPLFDTLDEHVQDAPRFSPAGGAFKDATEVRIEAGLYWKQGAIRYTTDGSDPTPASPVYSGPFTLNAPATIKAAVLDASGAFGPASAAQYQVNDVTPPRLLGASGIYESPTVTVRFSEPLGESGEDSSRYSIEPSIAVSGAVLAPSRREVRLILAQPPKTGTPYRLTVAGIKDASPAGNAMNSESVEFTVRGPVYTLASVGPDMMGRTLRDVPGLPVRAADPWTLNMYIKPEKQPALRTIIAGFGRCEQAGEGRARYIARFANGAHFWSHNRDVSSRAPIEVGKWQMLTATYDGKVLRLYKDGVKIGENTIGLSDDDPTISFAPKDPWEQRRQYEGEIKDFTIWGDCLEEEAVRGLWNAATK